MLKPDKASEVVITFDHPQVTTDTEWKIYKVPAGRKLRVRKSELVNPTGLAKDDTHYEVIKLRKAGATTIATWSTKTTGGDGDLPADTFTAMGLSATDAAAVLAEGEVLSLFADAGGVPTLPAGRVVVNAWLI